MEILMIILALIMVILGASIKIIRQQEEYVIERLGKYSRTLKPGIHFIIPLVDNVSKKVILKEQILDIPPQGVITKDNVLVQMNGIVYYKIINSFDSVYKIENISFAIRNLAATNLRNVSGNLDLNEILNSREKIQEEMNLALDEAVSNWGADISRVDIQEILPPEDVRRAMEKQLQADREKKALISKGEGEREYAILTAKGEAQSRILNAESLQKSKIIEAEGEAQSLKLVAKARRDSIITLKEANINREVMELQKLQSFEESSKNPANKIIIPSDLSSFTSKESLRAELWFDKENKTQEVKKEKTSKK